MHPSESLLRRSRLSLLGLVGLCAVLSACVSVPDQIAAQPEAPTAIKDVQENVAAYNGRKVRWGGTIVEVVNNSEFTDVLIVSRPLSRLQRPKSSDASSGRFIARVPGFVEPETYTEGRELTITGVITGIETLPIGKAQYAYPIVAVQGKHLWSKRATSYRTYPHYHGYHGYHHPHFWWEDDHHHRGHNGFYGSIFYHGKI